MLLQISNEISTAHGILGRHPLQFRGVLLGPGRAFAPLAGLGRDPAAPGCAPPAAGLLRPADVRPAGPLALAARAGQRVAHATEPLPAPDFEMTLFPKSYVTFLKARSRLYRLAITIKFY